MSDRGHEMEVRRAQIAVEERRVQYQKTELRLLELEEERVRLEASLVKIRDAENEARAKVDALHEGKG